MNANLTQRRDRDITLETIIDYILVPNCPPNYIGDIGYGPTPYGFPLAQWGGGYGMDYGPMYPSWGSTPCQLEKLQQVLAMLNTLLAPLSREAATRLLNTPVLTFVPGQGRTDITILEAAIIMRWPGLVSQLLQAGASPNVSTSGVSLVYQLMEDLYSGLDGQGFQEQQIIDLLLQDGSYVPPGFPGTVGIVPDAIRYGGRPRRHRHDHRGDRN